MKTIIAGSRDITDYICIRNAIIHSGINITEVVCGKARGVDTLGEQWAISNNIPVKYFPADWSTRAGGMIRNMEMAKYADALIAIRLGMSRGTTHMINTAIKEGLKVFLYQVTMNKWGSCSIITNRV